MEEPFFMRWGKRLKRLRSELFGAGALAVILVSLAAETLQAQLKNPGFEVDTPGSTVTDWTNITPDSGSAQTSALNPRSGSQTLAYAITGSAKAEMRSVSSIKVRNKEYIHVIAWAMAEKGRAAANLGLAIGTDNPGSTPTVNLIPGNGRIKLNLDYQYTGGGTADAYVKLIVTPYNGVASTVYWDDIVVYTNRGIASTDTIAPEPPIGSIVDSATANSLRVSWTGSAGDNDATSSGLGGYLVVRGTSDPTTVPLTNATYRTNYNSSLGTGTVVYYGPTNITSFTDTGLLPGTTYYYRVYAFDNALNYSTASPANGTTSYPPPPTLGAPTVQPALPVCAGMPVTLTETASGGTSPYSYQWQCNGSPIQGATASTLTVPAPVNGDTYACAVRSSGGVDWAVSQVLQLQVSTPPAVAALPASLLGHEQGTVVLRVEASGEGLGYQWRKDGEAVSGATGPALTLSPLRVADAGKYDVVVTSGACATNSTVLVLAVNQLPLAPILKLSRARGISLKINLPELVAGCTDPDLDSVSFLGVDQGQHGAQVSYDSSFIYYLPADDQDDVLSYRVGDSRGGSRSGRIEIAVISEVVEARTISVLDGVVRVRFAGIPNHGYRVERSATASGGTWEQVGSGKVPAGGVFEFEDGAAPKAGAYYRLVVEPQEIGS